MAYCVSVRRARSVSNSRHGHKVLTRGERPGIVSGSGVGGGTPRGVGRRTCGGGGCPVTLKIDVARPPGCRQNLARSEKSIIFNLPVHCY